MAERRVHREGHHHAIERVHLVGRVPGLDHHDVPGIRAREPRDRVVEPRRRRDAIMRLPATEPGLVRQRLVTEL